MNRLKYARQRLNRGAVDAITPPKKGRVYVYDTVTPGLAVCVTATDTRTFYLCRRIKGRAERVRIGTVDELTVEQARKQADKLIALIVNGDNPAEAKRDARVGMTLGDLWTLYLDQHAKPHKKSWKADEWLYTKFLSPWAGRLLTEVRRTDFQQLHAKIGKNSITNANRCRSLALTMFRFAAERGFEGANPVQGVRPFRERRRERFLSREELTRLQAALDEEHNRVVASAIRFALLTGARRGNWLSARWEEVDRERRQWVIPGAKAKAGKPIVVPLSDPAWELLESLRDLDPEWVFPGRDGPLRDIKTAWRRITKAAKLEGVRLHDLRRTFATFALAGGASLFHTAKVLGHASTEITEKVYAQAVDTGLLATVNAAAAAMSTAKPKQEVNQ